MILSSGQTLDFAPQALGELTPALSNGYYYAKDGVDLTGLRATYGALYRAQPSVATVVDKLAASAARLSLRVWDTTPATGKVEDVASGYADLMAKPCPFMSPFNFWRWTISTYEIYGEAFWYKVRPAPGAAPVGLLPMHPSRTSVKRDKHGATTYHFTLGVASAGILEASAEDVVPFARYNPDDLMRGLSRLEPLRSTLLNEDAARRGTVAFWKNGLRPSVYLEHPGELSEPAHNRIKAGIQQAHGGVDNTGKAAVLEEGMTAKVVQLSAEEMQYIEARKLNLQEVCMVFDVPPPVIHILDHATYSNITEQMRSMYRDTMAPRLEDVESALDFHLRPDFFSAPTHEARFALDEVLRGDFETRATAVGNLIEKGVMKPSEGRVLFDLPDAGDVAARLYGNAALVPLGSSVHGQEVVLPTGEIVQSPEPLGAPKPVDNQPLGDEAPAGAPAKRYDVRSVMGRLGRKAHVRDVKASLEAEHRSALSEYVGTQKSAAERGDDIATETFDATLAALLTQLGEATAKAIGNSIAKDLGGHTYDTAVIADWLHENGTASAKAVNAQTAADLKAYLDGNADAGAGDYFDGPAQSRVDSLAHSRVLVVGSLAALSSATQHKAGQKTWVTGDNPRPEHADMDGETVGINDVFSNGMNGPGDPAGGAEEVAGCNCSLSFGE